MHTEAHEWQARVAERNEMEVAKARFHQLEFRWDVPADCEPAGVPANRPEGGPRSVAADGKEVA